MDMQRREDELAQEEDHERRGHGEPAVDHDLDRHGEGFAGTIHPEIDPAAQFGRGRWIRVGRQRQDHVRP